MLITYFGPSWRGKCWYRWPSTGSIITTKYLNQLFIAFAINNMHITLRTLCTYIILFAYLRQDENGSDGDDRKGDDSRGFWWFYTADIVAGHANISWPHFPVSPSELRIRNSWFLIFVMDPDHKLKFKSKSWIQILLDLQYTVGIIFLEPDPGVKFLRRHTK